MTTPNGEAVHHDVFREMLTPVEGQAITMPGQGQTSNFDYDFTLGSNWQSQEIYVLAFVKETTSKEVLNSGTNLDPASVAVQDLPTQRLNLYPNPGHQTTYAQLPADDRFVSASISQISGENTGVSIECQGNMLEIPAGLLAPGLYIIQVTGEKNRYFGKLLVP